MNEEVTEGMMEQSATKRHLSSNADRFLEPPQNLVSFPDHLLPNCFQFLVLYIVYIGGLSSLVSCT